MLTSTQIRRRGAVLTALALATLLAALLLPSAAQAHNSEFHATAVAEGGSSLVLYDPPGLEPQQEWWHDCAVTIKHNVSTTTGLNWYRAAFKCNSWKGIFSEDDSITAAPADPAAANYTIRLGLFLRDVNTGILTPLHGTYDAWFRNGNGWSYGCQGEGRLSQVNPQVGKELVADLRVFGEQKYWHPIDLTWRTVPNTFKTHQTRSMRLATTWDEADPPSLGHYYSPDPMSGYFINQVGGSPNAYITDYCPLWTTIE